MKVWVLFRDNEEWERESRATPMAGYSDPVTAEAAAKALNDGDSYQSWGVAEVEIDGPPRHRFRACLDVINGQPDRDRYVSSRMADGPELGMVSEWWGRTGAMRDQFDFAKPVTERDKRPMCRVEAWAATPHEALALASARETELISDWETQLVLHVLAGAFA